MTNEELEKKHSDYIANIELWKLTQAAYDGTAALLELGVVAKKMVGIDKEEGKDDYKKRLKTIFGYSLSTRLIDIFISYLFSKPVSYNFQDIKKLADNELFSMFLTDCDKLGTPFNIYSQDRSLDAMIYGHVGVMSNMAKSEEGRTDKQDIEDERYSYLTTFLPQSIWDWEYDLENGTMKLSYLKLYDSLGRINIWWADKWEIWKKDDKKGYTLHDSGDNSLGYIPFSVLRDGKTKTAMLGTSKIKEIARCDAALLNTNHAGTEIIKYGANPMLQIPQMGDNSKQFIIAPNRVIEKSSRDPAIKAEFLVTQVLEPITAIRNWSEDIIRESYNSVDAGFMLDTGSGTESGEAKKRAFQSFNASLAKTSVNLQRLEKSLITNWLSFQNMPEFIDEIAISRPKEFDIQSLSDDIDVFSISVAMVNSETYSKEIQKTVVAKTLPDLTLDTKKAIASEIDSFKTPKVSDIDIKNG